MLKNSIYHGVGRRKAAVARVWLKQGAGNILVNDRDLSTFFSKKEDVITVKTALSLLEKTNDFDIKVNVFGGGTTGQADAIKLGITRSLVSFDQGLRPVLKRAGLLTVDSRKVERKKPGQKKARKKFQFVKR